MQMFLKDVAKEVAKKTGFQIKDVEFTLRTFLECVSEGLVKGFKYTFTNYFSLYTSTIGERSARDFSTKEVIKVPEHRRVRIKVSKTLKDRMNNN